MDAKLLALYGLKFNPFGQSLPAEALLLTPRVDAFCWRVEQLVREGGFACVTGDPGTGKSVALRLLTDRLAPHRDVRVAVLIRPQSAVADFYRELGALFGVPLHPHNRRAGANALRTAWLDHIERARVRPVLIVDEAQEMKSLVLAELRLLSSERLDTSNLLTIVLAGDHRLSPRLRTSELRPILSRVRTHLTMPSADIDELRRALDRLLGAAGAPHLLTDALKHTLAEHAAGNYRALTAMGAELLAAAVRGEHKQIDEALFFEVFGVPSAGPTERAAAARA